MRHLPWYVYKTVDISIYVTWKCWYQAMWSRNGVSTLYGLFSQELRYNNYNCYQHIFLHIPHSLL